ncbi:MAG: acyltransferase [Bacteroidales bacterium]|nr:acyltransferase [Bacteroidales bacterium]
MENKRIDYIDTLRAFAIFLVTLGHCLDYGGYKDSVLINLIYSFHMPLFICISGFVISYSYERKSINEGVISLKRVFCFIYKKFISIMLPYYAWSLFVLPLFFYTYNGTINYSKIIESTFITNLSFWFLPCLFGLSVIYILYKYITKKVILQSSFYSLIYKVLCALMLFAVVVVLYKVSNYDFFRSVINYFIPFAIGVMMSEFKRINRLVCDNGVTFFISLISFCLLAGLFNNSSMPSIEKLIRLLCGVLSIPVFFNFFKHIEFHEKVRGVINYVGRNTLIIYILQFSFVENLISFQNMNFLLQLFYFGLISICLIALILLISKMLERSNYLRLFLLGRK